jgi:hypothetical protein
MEYSAYREEFQKKYAEWKIPTGATECGPFLQPTRRPDLPPWRLFWCIIYPDEKYARIVEYFDVDPRLGLRHGVRVQFVFHYGPCSKRKPDAQGCPKPTKRTEIRFDLSTDQYQDHLHYQGKDHIAQANVVGLTIRDMTTFRFIEEIERHRRTGQSLHECFGFTLRQR